MLAPLVTGAEPLHVTFHPESLRVGEVGWLEVRGVPPDATLEATVGGQLVTFFPYGRVRAALVGVDLETGAGIQPWRVDLSEPGRDRRTARGSVKVLARSFPLQRLTLPPGMVDLDPETERRATDEAGRLRALYRTITPERLWDGAFTRPVAGTEPGTGFGARRIINGKPRMPHSGIDFAAPRGTPVTAANRGRVALVAEYFFPGRLVALDHGLGVYTLYFHLDDVYVEEGALVARGDRIGSVGATGRATGPHLHFAALVGSARVDPATLLGLDLRD